MIDWIEMGCSLLAGAALGLLYFGGLWWTVARLHLIGSPVTLYLSSLLFRVGVAVLCLYLILQLGVLQLLAAMVGFVGIRLVLVRQLGLGNRRNLHSSPQSNIG